MEHPPARGRAATTPHHLARNYMAPAPARCEPFLAFPLLPGPPTCPARPSAAPAPARYEPIPAFPLLPGPSTCPAWPSAASVAAGYEPFSANRLTPASRDYVPGTMAAGARSRCALKKRGISFAKTRRFRATDYSHHPAPVRGTFAVAWNIAVRTRGVFTHRTGFQKLACAERGLVRTGRPRQTHTIQKTALWRTQGT